MAQQAKTGFIDAYREELFTFPPARDRANKVLKFLAEVAVNGHPMPGANPHKPPTELKPMAPSWPTPGQLPTDSGAVSYGLRYINLTLCAIFIASMYDAHAFRCLFMLPPAPSAGMYCSMKAQKALQKLCWHIHELYSAILLGVTRTKACLRHGFGPWTWLALHLPLIMY